MAVHTGPRAQQVPAHSIWQCASHDKVRELQPPGKTHTPQTHEHGRDHIQHQSHQPFRWQCVGCHKYDGIRGVAMGSMKAQLLQCHRNDEQHRIYAPLQCNLPHNGHHDDGQRQVALTSVNNRATPAKATPITLANSIPTGKGLGHHGQDLCLSSALAR